VGKLQKSGAEMLYIAVEGGRRVRKAFALANCQKGELPKYIKPELNIEKGV